jgi:PBSX family phage portal protein
MSKWITDVKEDTSHVEGVMKVTGFNQGIILEGYSNEDDNSEFGMSFGSHAEISPPYDPRALALLFERSSSLRPNVDSYVVNIDSFGHRFEPKINLDADDANEQVANAMIAERIASAPRTADPMTLIPTPEQVEARKTLIAVESRIELLWLQSWFSSCCVDSNFIELRKSTREDIESGGNGYWEIVRDRSGRIARLYHVDSQTIRITTADDKFTIVDDPVFVSPVTTESVKTPKRFRRYVQINQATSARTYFKQFGDPRVISRKTGKVASSIAALIKDGDAAATELVHFQVRSSRSVYGVPRWIGNLLSVLGSRSMEQVNLAYFENKSVPPMAVLVSGGARMTPETTTRIERFISENIKGKDNFWSILVLQAESSGEGGDGRSPKIDLKPLTSAQISDATHLLYDERNIDKIGSAFRLPRILRGDTRDFNRATAETALRFAEDQIFGPERDAFDFWMNIEFMPRLGVKYWDFTSQTRRVRDPERLTAQVKEMVRHGVLTPEEGRELAGDVFNRRFAKIEEDWVKRPIPLTLAGIQTSQSRPDETRSMPSQDRPTQVAQRYFDIRDNLLKEYGLSLDDDDDGLVVNLSGGDD